MYARDQKRLRAYLELAELLISRGAEVSAEDDYGSTPLDFQEIRQLRHRLAGEMK